MTPENSKKPIRRGGLQLHPLQVCDRVHVVIKLPIPVGAEVRWCEHAASSKLGMLLGRRREHLGSKFRPLRVIENGVQLATANHPSQTIHVSLARSRHCLWTPSEFVLNGHGASNVRLWPDSAAQRGSRAGPKRLLAFAQSGRTARQCTGPSIKMDDGKARLRVASAQCSELLNKFGGAAPPQREFHCVHSIALTHVESISSMIEK